MSTAISRRTLGVAALVVLAGAMSGCGKPTYADRTDDLNKQFEMGQRSRSQMLERGATIDASDCTDMWVNSGASSHHEHSQGKDWSYLNAEKSDSGVTYKDLRKQYFVNGCLDRERGIVLNPSPSPSTTGR